MKNKIIYIYIYIYIYILGSFSSSRNEKKMFEKKKEEMKQKLDGLLPN